MTEPRYVPPTDGQPADIEESPDDVSPLPFDVPVGTMRCCVDCGGMVSIKAGEIHSSSLARCRECDGTRGMHRTNCPYYKG